MPKQHRDERGGHDRQEPPQTEHERQRREPDEQRDPARLPEVAEQSPELLEEVAVGLLDAEQLRDLADDDREREPDDEALEHGLRDEAREEAEAAEPGEQCDHADDERERDRELHELVRSDGSERGDRRGRECRSRGHRPGHEVARAAEGGVEDQRRRCRVQAVDRRNAGDRGVGERLRHEHGPDRQPGDQVAAQPGALVAGCPREERQPPHPDNLTGPAAGRQPLPARDDAHRSSTTPSRGRAQQMSTLPSAGGSTGSGS